MIMPQPKGWHSRGYLPHFDSPETVQFVTFRLADSLPRSVVEAIMLQSDTVRNVDRERHAGARRASSFRRRTLSAAGMVPHAEPCPHRIRNVWRLFLE